MIPCNNNNGICFHRELSYLSNFYKAPLYYKDKLFLHSEQAYQWAKASCANDHEKVKEILSQEDPYKVKHLGSETPTSDKWTLLC